MLKYNCIKKGMM